MASKTLKVVDLRPLTAQPVREVLATYEHNIAQPDALMTLGAGVVALCSINALSDEHAAGFAVMEREARERARMASDVTAGPITRPADASEFRAVMRFGTRPGSVPAYDAICKITHTWSYIKTVCREADAEYKKTKVMPDATWLQAAVKAAHAKKANKVPKSKERSLATIAKSIREDLAEVQERFAAIAPDHIVTMLRSMDAVDAAVIAAAKPVEVAPVKTPEQLQIEALQAQLAALTAKPVAAPPPVQPAPVKTPEQLMIEDLQAKLAAASKPAKSKPAKGNANK